MFEGKTYTSEQVAEFLGVSIRTIYRYIHDTKELQAFKIGGQWKITEQALRDFIQSRSSSNLPPDSSKE